MFVFNNKNIKANIENLKNLKMKSNEKKNF